MARRLRPVVQPNRIASPGGARRAGMDTNSADASTCRRRHIEFRMFLPTSAALAARRSMRVGGFVDAGLNAAGGFLGVTSVLITSSSSGSRTSEKPGSAIGREMRSCKKGLVFFAKHHYPCVLGSVMAFVIRSVVGRGMARIGMLVGPARQTGPAARGAAMGARAKSGFDHCAVDPITVPGECRHWGPEGFGSLPQDATSPPPFSEGLASPPYVRDYTSHEIYVPH